MIELKVTCDRCNTLFNPVIKLVGHEVQIDISVIVTHPIYTKKTKDGGTYFANYDLCHMCRKEFDDGQSHYHDTFFEKMLTKPGRTTK